MLTILPMVNFRGTKKIEVIETTVYEGENTEENRGRFVTYYSDLEGNVLAKNDPNCEPVCPKKAIDLGTLTISDPQRNEFEIQN